MASRDHALPIVFAHAAGQHYDCHSCTTCCRDLVVHLLPADKDRLDARPWEEALGALPYLNLRGAWVLNKRPDGRCVFLEDDGKCRIHREYGRSEKPFACQLFPFTIVRGEDQRRIGWRFDCPSIARSAGRPVHKHENDVRELAVSLAALAGEGAAPGARGPASESEAAHAIARAGEAWLARANVPAARRLRGLATLGGILADRSFAGLDPETFATLASSVAAALDEAAAPDLAPSTPRERAMLRLATFAHCEHVSLEEALSPWRRWMIRFEQLKRARRMRRGRGLAPSLHGGDGAVSFAAIDAMPVARQDAPAIGDLLLRYLRVSLSAHGFCGPAYYGWSARNGLLALCLRMPIVGWLARYYAAAAARDAVTFEDVVSAIGRVDQAAGRLKTLGSPAERLRLTYLTYNQRLLRLMNAYPLTAEAN